MEKNKIKKKGIKQFKIAKEEKTKKKTIKKKSSVSRVNYYMPKLLDPRYGEMDFMRPKDRRSLNKIIRWFYIFHPLVHNIINLHSTYPVSKFKLTNIKDSYIIKFYENVADKLNIMRLMVSMLREYNLVGEVFPYGVWDSYEGIFKNVVLLDPDDIDVISFPLLGDDEDSLIYLRADDNLVDLIKSDEDVRSLVESRLDDKIIKALSNGEDIKLPSFNISHIASFSSPKATRGIGLVQSIMNTLFYEQKLLSSEVAAANRIINPILIYTLSPQLENTEISQEDINEFTELMQQARMGNLSEIIYWQKVEMKNNNTKLPSINYSRIDEMIMSGLMVNKAIVTASGPTWNSTSIAKRILMSRYTMQRDLFEDYFYKKIFIQIAKAHLFYRTKKAFGGKIKFKKKAKKISLDKIVVKGNLKKGAEVGYNGFLYKVEESNVKEGWVILSGNDDVELIIPKINWRGKLDLSEDDKMLQFLQQGFDKGSIPFKVLADMYDLDEGYIRDNLLREKGTVFDYFYRKSQDKALSKDGDVVYNNILMGELEKFYKSHPDEKPKEFDDKLKNFKEGAQEDSLGQKCFEKKYKVIEKDEVYLGLGYGSLMIGLIKDINNNKLDPKNARKILCDNLGIVCNEDGGNLFDVYWDWKFKFWNKNGVHKVYKASNKLINDLGDSYKEYKKGIIKEINTGFVMYSEINNIINGVEVLGMPVYIYFLRDRLKFKESVKKIVFSNEDDLVDGKIFISKNRSGIELFNYIIENFCITDKKE